MGKRFLPVAAGMALGVIFLAGSMALPQTASSSPEGDFQEAKSAVAAARDTRADRYAPELLEQAEDLLAAAESARNCDAVKFSQASRLSRAYAELARATAELKREEESLAAAREELRKARADLDAVKKSP